jgi:pyruvate/2-oxoglutarate dehydrogenase complex dihydrolipoamide acyltransferase (E2) component
MTLKLVLPFLERGVEWARITVWHKRAGDHVGYGDVVCDVVVEEVVRHSQPPEGGLAQLFDAPPSPLYQIRHRGLAFRLALVASDAGWMRRICVPEGETSKVGDVLALVTSRKDEDDAPGDEAAAASTFRVVANVGEAGDDLAVTEGLAGE